MQRLSPLLILIFLVASFLIYFFGDSGVLAFRDLEVYRQRLEANVESLRQHNQSLTAELTDLKDNAELGIVMARRLGLYRPDDKVVKVQGVSTRVERYVVGDLLKQKKKSDARSALVKSAAVGIATVMIVYVLISSRVSRRKRRGSQSE